MNCIHTVSVCTVNCVLCTVYILCQCEPYTYCVSMYCIHTMYCVLGTVNYVLCTMYCIHTVSVSTVYILCSVNYVLCTMYCIHTVYVNCVLCTMYCIHTVLVCTVNCVVCTPYEYCSYLSSCLISSNGTPLVEIMFRIFLQT